MQQVSPLDHRKTSTFPSARRRARILGSVVRATVRCLRATEADDNILLLKTNMGAGHGGKSGRWESLREYADEMAFVLWQLGVEG